MVSQKYKRPHLLHHFFLPYWQLSNQLHTMMKSKPGAATSIKCCQIQMDLVLSIHFTSSQDCFRSVNCQCMVVCLKSFTPAFKTILPLCNCRSHKIMVERSLRKQIKSRQKNYIAKRMLYGHTVFFPWDICCIHCIGVLLLRKKKNSSKKTVQGFLQALRSGCVPSFIF